MNSKLQNRLLQYEVQPPEKIWNDLSEILDLGEKYPFRKRLYNFEKLPASGIWSDIIAKLNRTHAGIPLVKRYRLPLKYSGVAAALLTFAVISSLLISKKSESELPDQKMVHQSTIPGINLPVQENQGDHPEASAERGNSRKSYSLRDRVSIQLRTRQANTMAFLNNPPRHSQRNISITSGLPVEKYMVYSDAEGHAVRLPKKLFDAYACPDDHANCKLKLKKLQEKIASSSMTSDLSGILEMLNNMQENQ